MSAPRGRRRRRPDGAQEPRRPGRVLSPGGWSVPRGRLAAWDWLPPGGASPRPDLAPWWLRAWYRTPCIDRWAYDRMWWRGCWEVLPPPDDGAGGVVAGHGPGAGPGGGVDTAGEADLQVLLATLAAERVPGRFVFVTSTDPQLVRELDAPATVQDAEGLSLVVTQEQADRAGLAYGFVAAWLTLRVHSALAAVGLTAAVSAALSSEGIACNVVAGSHHDHLLVPVAEAEHALAVLQELSRRARPGPGR